MAKQQFLAACAFSVLAIACASPATAQVGGDAGAQTVPTNKGGIQPAGTDDENAPQKDIVVTGSIIRGTPEDAALPVDVIGSEELSKQGSPTPVELLKNLPTSSAVLGDSNQFDSRSQGAEGIATANLRGLSPQRTLVLLNSKRLTTAGNGIPAVDLNLLPQAAIGRVEVLKDGAAATYGSDAVAGVINFITRTDQEGFNVAGNYRFVKGSDGDQDVSLSYGHRGDGFRLLVAAGFQKRGQLLTRDRDFAVQPFAVNPQGGFTGGGNPANFIAVGPTGALLTVTGPTGLVGAIQADSSCAALGGTVGRPYAARPTGQCYTQYSPYDSLVDLEKRGQAFVDFEANLTGSTKFEVTLLYGRTTVPHYLTSPSYILTQSPSPAAFTTPAGTPATPFAAFGGSGFFVPANNPGLVAYRAANPTQFPGATTNGNALFPTLLFRPFLAGGNPLFLSNQEESGSSRGSRISETFRATAELRGPVTDSIDYNLSTTYHDYFRQTTGYDSVRRSRAAGATRFWWTELHGHDARRERLSLPEPVRQPIDRQRGDRSGQSARIGGARQLARSRKLHLRQVQHRRRHRAVRGGRFDQRLDRVAAARRRGAVRLGRAVSLHLAGDQLRSEQQYRAKSVPRLSVDR